MSITITVMTIPGAPLEGVNPLPIFHHKGEVDIAAALEFPAELRVDLGNRSPVLPYKMQDRYSRRRIPLKKKTIVLENEYLKASFWPEDGGRLYSLYDKGNKAELLMSNPVYQPGNLAIRNAWLSGGIEWNFGTLGHHARTCDHLFAAIVKDPQGEEFLRMYEFDRTKNAIIRWISICRPRRPFSIAMSSFSIPSRKIQRPIGGPISPFLRTAARASFPPRRWPWSLAIRPA